MPIKTFFRTISVRLYASKAVELSYKVYGELKSTPNHPLIVAHGLFGSKSNFKHFCRKYQELTNRTIYSVDLRNHGDSPHTPDMNYELFIEDFKAILEKFGISKSAFLGHSIGGKAAMAFALQHPLHVEKLIIGDISPFSRRDDNESFISLVEAIESIPLPKNVPLGIARRQVNETLQNRFESKFFRQFMLMNLVDDGHNGVKWRCNFTAIKQNYKALQNIPVVQNMKFDGPTLSVIGEHSEYFSKDDEGVVRTYFPNVHFEYVSGAGHWLHAEKPDEFLQITAHFLNKS